MSTSAYTVTDTLHQDEFFTFLRGMDGNGIPVFLQCLRPAEPSTVQLTLFRRLYERMRRFPDGICRGTTLSRLNGKPCISHHDFHPGSRCLDHFLKEGGIDLGKIPDLALFLIKQLQQLHRSGICYLNLNPDTIFYDPGHQRGQLIDFSLTQECGGEMASPET